MGQFLEGEAALPTELPEARGHTLCEIFGVFHGIGIHVSLSGIDTEWNRHMTGHCPGSQRR